MAPKAQEQIVRHLLTAIDDDAGVSQRKLSSEIGIAVGSINWHLKRCVNKGLIKLQQAPVKRYLYYLTPKGFEEKAQLTASFIQSSLELYRSGRKECADFFQECARNNKETIFLMGDGDLAEIAVVSAMEAGNNTVSVIDADSGRKNCAGVAIVKNIQAAILRTGGAPPDAVLLTNLNNPETTYRVTIDQLNLMGLPNNIIHVLRILNFKPSNHE